MDAVAAQCGMMWGVYARQTLWQLRHMRAQRYTGIGVVKSPQRCTRHHLRRVGWPLLHMVLGLAYVCIDIALYWMDVGVVAGGCGFFKRCACCGRLDSLLVCC
jgi:hypothetical protein